MIIDLLLSSHFAHIKQHDYHVKHHHHHQCSIYHPFCWPLSISTIQQQQQQQAGGDPPRLWIRCNAYRRGEEGVDRCTAGDGARASGQEGISDEGGRGAVHDSEAVGVLDYDDDDDDDGGGSDSDDDGGDDDGGDGDDDDDDDMGWMFLFDL